MLSDLAGIYLANPVLFLVSVGLVGLIVGSFLNVVIYRLPLILEREWRAQATEFLPTVGGEALQGSTNASAPDAPFTLSVPRSACPSCGAPIKAWHNVPVISWLALRGRCAACRAPISFRYPLVECVTGILSAWAAWHFGFGSGAVCAVIVTWALIALTGIDIDHQLLPDNITLPLLWLGLVAAVTFGDLPGQSLPVSPQNAILGALCGYLSLWTVFHVFRLITGKEGMGYGDFKLFAALGAWLGWKMLPLIILLAAGAGAIIGISMIALRGRDRAQPMPFGPYLAIAGWIAMMYGDGIVDGYLRLSGLKH